MSTGSDTNEVSQVRARDLGIEFPGEPGPQNAITDVPGVEVGYVTLVEESPAPIRTGVTAILPRGKHSAAQPCAAGVSVLNGNGELTGRSWIEEAGQLQSPVMITNSHSVGAAHTGVGMWVANKAPQVATQWVLPVVGETWDGYLNSINEFAVTPEHAVQAIENASADRPAEGNVGGGTGMIAYGFKGGTGTASRVVRSGEKSWTVGVMLQANFGRRDHFVIQGVPLGKNSKAANPVEQSDWLQRDTGATKPAEGGEGSVIVVVATDAPLLPTQCEALARRVSLGLARTGTTGSHFSGDLFLAFSTANAGALSSRLGKDTVAIESLEFVNWASINPFFDAVVEATEEAVINAMVAARDMRGRDGNFAEALPHAEVTAAFRSR